MAEKKRWRRIARIFLIIILILGAALGAVVAVAVNQPEMLGLGETLARQIEEATGLECRVGGPVELGIFPEPHIQAYRVMIYAPASDQAQAKNDQFERQTAAAADADMAQPANPASEQELLLNIAAVRVEVKVLPLLWGAFELKRLKIYDPLLHLDVLTKQWPELGVGASADPGSGSGPDSDPDFGPAPDTETPVFGGPAAVNASLPPASVLSDIPVTPPLPELEAASVETWETIIDLLQGIRVSGGVILDKTAAGDSQVLVSGLSFRARGDDLSLSLRSHILADERNAPSTLDLRLNDLRLSGNALSAALELRADINILQQSVEPDIQVNLSYDLLSGSLRLDDLRLALEKLRIKGTAALDFGGPEFSAQGNIEFSGLSLTRWFEFGRNLPGSLQYALDDLDGLMEFTLTPDYVEVSRLEATILGRLLRGRGGCPDFSAPEVVIDAHAAFLDINDIFPEVIDPPLQDLPRVQYEMGFLVPPIGEGVEIDDSDLPDVGYDITIATDEATVRKLRVSDLACRIVPSARGTQCLFSMGETAGGVLDADLTILSGTGLIEVDAAFTDLEIRTLGEDLFGRGPLTAKAGGTAKFTARPDTLDILFRTMDLECAVKFGAGSLELRSTNRALQFDSAEASGAGSSRAGQLDAEELDTMLVFDGNWQFKAVSGAEKISARLGGAVGVDEQSLDLAVFGGQLQADVHADMPWLGVTPKNQIKLGGLFSYDDRDNHLELNKAVITLPYGEVSGNIRGRDQGFPSEAWSGKVTLTVPSTREWLGYMGFDQADLPEQGLNKGVFSFSFAQSGKTWSVKDAEVSLDDGIKGKVSLGQTAADKYTVDARFNEVDMDVYYPTRKTSSALPSPRPWDLSGLLKQSVTGAVHIDTLRWRKLNYNNVQLGISLRNGKFSLPVQGEFYQGRFAGMLEGALEKHRVNSQLNLEFNEVQLGQLTRDVYDDAMAEGLFSASVRADGAPDRSSEIVTAYSGQWAFVVGTGYFRARQEEGAVEPSRTEFSSITASGRLGGGRLETGNFTMSSPGSTDTTGSGYVDLVDDTIQLDLIVRMLGIDVPVRVAGPLDDPGTSVKSGKLIGNAVGGIGRGLFGLMVDVISLPGRIISLPFSSNSKESGSSGGSE